MGDVNRDGVPDVVTANEESYNVSVLLGRGDGTFYTQKTFTVGTYPASVAVADVNGDRLPDLVTANEGSNNVSVLLGRGDGTFHGQNTFAVGSKPLSVAVADVNRDGVPDVVTANAGSNNVSVLLGRGDGTFHGQNTFAVGSKPVSVAVGDVNRDGVPDVVTANNESYNVSVLLGRGNGTFHAQITFSVGYYAYPRSVAIADVNGDGRPDLLTANAGNNDVSVLLGRGDGTFETLRTFTVGSLPYSVVVADVNGDGQPDLVAANTGGNYYPDSSSNSTVSVLIGDVRGIWHLPTSSTASAPVEAIEIVFPKPMDTRSFSLSDDVGSFIGPTGPIVPTGFSWVSERSLAITFPAQALPGYYEMVLGPLILDTKGNLMDADGDGIAGEIANDQYMAAFVIDGTGPHVFYVEPGEQASAPWDEIVLHFNEAIDPGTISVYDIKSFNGPSGADLRGILTNVAVVDNQVVFDFAAQSVRGLYTITLGPQIADLTGNLMDQNRDQANGQNDDVFTFTVDLHSPDLQAEWVADPTGGVFGETMTFDWRVTNEGNDDAAGRWTDYVYLSADSSWDLNDTLVGTYVYDSSERGPLAADGGMYEGSLTLPIPAVLPGSYRLLVRTNLRQDLSETSFANNETISSAAATFDLPSLIPGSSVSKVVNYGELQYYRIDVSEENAGRALELNFVTSPTHPGNELYVRFGALPTRVTHDSKLIKEFSNSQRAVATRVKAGTYYVLVIADPRPSGSGVLGEGTIDAAFTDFAVFDATFGQGGTAGNRTIEIHGFDFDRSVTATLVDDSGQHFPAAEYFRANSEKLYATFRLTNVPAGTYDVWIEDSAGTRHVVTHGMQVVAGGGDEGQRDALGSGRVQSHEGGGV